MEICWDIFPCIPVETKLNKQCLSFHYIVFSKTVVGAPFFWTSPSTFMNFETFELYRLAFFLPPIFTVLWALWVKPNCLISLLSQEDLHSPATYFPIFITPIDPEPLSTRFPLPPIFLALWALWVKLSSLEQLAIPGKLPFSCHLSSNLHQTWNSWTKENNFPPTIIFPASWVF